MATSRATAGLVAMYAAAGLAVEIDAGQVGLVVYGATPGQVEWVARSLARGPASLGVAVEVSAPAFEADEREGLQFWATVSFDWDAMPASKSACVAVLGKAAS